MRSEAAYIGDGSLSGRRSVPHPSFAAPTSDAGPRDVSGRPDAAAREGADTGTMTSSQLIRIADEWQTALSVAEDALTAAAFIIKDLRARRSSLTRERLEVAQSLVALARVLHLRADLCSLAKPEQRQTASSY